MVNFLDALAGSLTHRLHLRVVVHRPVAFVSVPAEVPRFLARARVDGDANHAGFVPGSVSRDANLQRGGERRGGSLGDARGHVRDHEFHLDLVAGVDADVHERDVVGEGVVGVAEGDGLEGEGEVGGDGALDLGRRGGRLEAHDVAEVLGEDDEGDDDVGGVIRGELLHRGVGVVRGVRLRARALGGGGGRGVADVRISLGEGEVVGGDVVVREAPVEVVLGEAVLRLEGGGSASASASADAGGGSSEDIERTGREASPKCGWRDARRFPKAFPARDASRAGSPLDLGPARVDGIDESLTQAENSRS